MPASVIYPTDIKAALNWRGFRLYQEPHYHAPLPIHHHELPELPPPIHYHELPEPPPPMIHYHELPGPPAPELDGRRRNVTWLFALGFGLLAAYYEEDD